MTNISIPLKYPVVKNPKILGGTPVIKGTRVPASLVLDLFKRGYNLELIKNEYPSLSHQKLNAFLALVSHSFDVSPSQAI